MLKNELKAALAVLGTVFVPMVAQADMNSMNSPQMQKQQQPGVLPGTMIEDGQVPAAYPQSAALVCDNGWDVTISANYLYWKWSQDSSLLMGTLVDQPAGFNGTTTPVFNNPGYTSGFKVGLGLGLPEFDNWDLNAEYTWYRNTNNQSVTGTASKGLAIEDYTNAYGTYASGTINSEARLGYQTLDFLARRAMYFGKQLTFRIGTGLRAQWISEEFELSSSGLTALEQDNPEFTSVSVSAARNLTSWQLGPKLSMDLKWLLGAGFSIMGNLHNSLLYTSYNSSQTASGTVDSTAFTNTVTGLSNYGTVRPVTEAFLGLGWEMYFCDNNFHFDLFAGYDFNVYWNYDMLGAGFQSPGDMMLQGLNIGVHFDF